MSGGKAYLGLFGDMAEDIGSLLDTKYGPALAAWWRAGPGGFGSGASSSGTASVDLKALHANIRELALENDFLEGALTKAIC